MGREGQERNKCPGRCLSLGVVVVMVVADPGEWRFFFSAGDSSFGDSSSLEQ